MASVWHLVLPKIFYEAWNYIGLCFLKGTPFRLAKGDPEARGPSWGPFFILRGALLSHQSTVAYEPIVSVLQKYF